MNRVCRSGRVSDGPKIGWSEAGKAACTFTLIIEETARERLFKTFVNVCVVGAKAEETCEMLEPGSYVEVVGKLGYKAGKTKGDGKLMVRCFGVEVISISTLAQAVESPN